MRNKLCSTKQTWSYRSQLEMAEILPITRRAALKTEQTVFFGPFRFYSELSFPPAVS